MSGIQPFETSLGTARLHVDTPAHDPAGTLVLGHGAGGGVDASDLRSVAGAATAAGWQVVRLEQPWRVAGKRVAPAPPRLDAVTREVLAALPVSGPLVLGGRSAGARVACRLAPEVLLPDGVRAAGVLALAFPLHPPGRPERSRAAEAREVTAAGMPLLVVQGRSDPFGTPAQVREEVPGAHVVEVDGAHSGSPAEAARAASTWLRSMARSPRAE